MIVAGDNFFVLTASITRMIKIVLDQVDAAKRALEHGEGQMFSCKCGVDFRSKEELPDCPMCGWPRRRLGAL